MPENASIRGGHPRAPARWQTDFGRWVSDFGVSRIVAALDPHPDLRVTKGAVYHWLQGHAPSPARAFALVQLSRGRLTLEAIYGHGREIRKRHRA